MGAAIKLRVLHTGLEVLLCGEKKKVNKQTTAVRTRKLGKGLRALSAPSLSLSPVLYNLIVLEKFFFSLPTTTTIKLCATNLSNIRTFNLGRYSREKGSFVSSSFHPLINKFLLYVLYPQLKFELFGKQKVFLKIIIFFLILQPEKACAIIATSIVIIR